MKYLAAYALLALGGKTDITAEDVKRVLGTVSASINDEDLNRVISSLKGKQLHELISNGLKKLGGSAAAVPAAKGGAKDEKKKEEKKEEKKPEPAKKKEEPKPAEPEDDFGLAGGLFD